MARLPRAAAVQIPMVVALLIAAGCERHSTLGAADARGESAGAGAISAREIHATESGMNADTDDRLQTATFGAGCFWGVESVFRQLDGVVDAAVGYSGGLFENPTYQDVCSDRTGHAEVVQIRYDPAAITYDKLLSVFWKCHDPTQVNRQGPDVGSQYRSVIFYHTPQQKVAAESSREALAQSGKHRRPIATEIVPAATFYRAEEYHQQYLAKRGLPNCHIPDDE